jgi:predicted nucleotidyltransferase
MGEIVMLLAVRLKEAIVQAVLSAYSSAKIWLFGSHADDSKKVGDIDIVILSKVIANDVLQKLNIGRETCDQIGKQKNDTIAARRRFLNFRLPNGVASNEQIR